MRAMWMVLAVTMLAGCSLEQQNGDLRIKPGPFLAKPEWRVSRQERYGAANRLCMVSAGDVDVTLLLENGRRLVQVATTTTVQQGDTYSLIMDGRNYKSAVPVFKPSESRRIVEDMLSHDVLYSELRTLTMASRMNASLPKGSSKISLADFATVYHACEAYLDS